MSVVLSVEETGPCQRQVKVEVPAPAVEAELDRVTREFRQQTRMPGFRKGKVPLDLVRRKFSEDIEKEVLDRLLPRYWRQAQAETRLEALLPPRVEQVGLEEGEPLTFVAVVETRPEIELGDLAGFQLPEVELSVAAEEVDRALDDIRRQVADWVVVDRPAGRGDLVVADMTELAEAEQPPQRVAFEVGDDEVWEELSLAASGKAAGGRADFSRTDGEGEEARTRAFRLELVEVKERDLPELDDALAGKVGRFEGLHALRHDIQARLMDAKRRRRLQVRERSLLEQLQERHPVPLPEGLVEHELEHLLHEYADQLRMRGVELETAQADWQRISGELRPQAQRRVHARLLLDAAADKLEVEVEEWELEAALASIAEAQGRSAQAVRQALARDERLKELRAQLLRQKTMRRLLGEEESPPEAAEAAAETIVTAETAGEE
jgi:trigger factor